MGVEYEVGRVKKCPTVKCDPLNRWINQYCVVIGHYVVETCPLQVSLDFNFFCELDINGMKIFDLDIIFRTVFGAFGFLEPGHFFTISFDVKLLFERSDNFICINVFFLEFLVMGTALKTISGSNEVRHLFVELVGSKKVNFYLLFSL